MSLSRNSLGVLSTSSFQDNKRVKMFSPLIPGSSVLVFFTILKLTFGPLGLKILKLELETRDDEEISKSLISVFQRFLTKISFLPFRGIVSLESFVIVLIVSPCKSYNCKVRFYNKYGKIPIRTYAELSPKNPTSGSCRTTLRLDKK